MPACLRSIVSASWLFEDKRLQVRKKRDGSSSRTSKSHSPAWGFCTPDLHGSGMKQRRGNDGVQMKREEGKRDGERKRRRVRRERKKRQTEVP